MSQKKNHITIKGTKEGLNFFLDDSCAYADLLLELKEKLSSKHYQHNDDRQVYVNVNIGNRYLTKDQESKLRSLIVSNNNLQIDKIDSNVISKEEAEAIRRQKQVVTVAKMVRSGQVLEVEGDLLLIGDVNPGGKVMATGNVFVLGALRGAAHAGFTGNTEAVIAASLMAPSRLQIADLMSEQPNRTEQVASEMECAYIDETSNTISIERLQILQQLRPNLTIY
ncbi:septum site-determining protein MinC [Bacillus alkalicellulosilyticus]|uniref:septum site-determining protein MinC n=1 Tax=Alkalihalobacterium alkalicellulosilyticum TaxID=1912214 RepID=UPI000996C7EB|nr:septum site-determining protein MinC [Bacillus alkalicellulosilyticus]